MSICDPMDCSMPDFPVLHHLQEFAQTHVYWVDDDIQPSHPLLPPFSSCPQSFPESGSFPVSWLFTSGGQSIGASSSASVLPMNIQGWYPLGLTDLISLLSKRLSRVFFSTTVQKHHFFSTQPSLWGVAILSISSSKSETWKPFINITSHITHFDDYARLRSQTLSLFQLLFLNSDS